MTMLSLSTIFSVLRYRAKASGIRALSRAPSARTAWASAPAGGVVSAISPSPEPKLSMESTTKPRRAYSMDQDSWFRALPE